MSSAFIVYSSLYSFPSECSTHFPVLQSVFLYKSFLGQRLANSTENPYNIHIMKKGLSLKTALTALAASFVWGTAFAFQRMAAGHIGAITFNFYRSVLAALSLGVLLFVSNRRKKPEERKKSDPKKIAIGGTVCGVLVIAASIVQQYAIADVEAGKAGFLTTLYILLVPLFSVVFLHKRVAPSLWVSVLLGLTGLYFISVKEGFTISPSDALVLLSAGIYAVYILAADYYVRFCSPTELNCAQFIVASVVCLIGMFAVEEKEVSVCMGRDKVRDHMSTGAEYITGADSSCLMHMQGVIDRERLPIKTLHIVEILTARQ